MTPPNEPREPDEVAIALNAIPVPRPTDPTITNYERQGKVVAWSKGPVIALLKHPQRLPKETP